MKRLQPLVWALICFGSLGFVAATPVDATLIVADTSGANNNSNENFYGVSFIYGSGLIESVTFDLTPYDNAFFDLDGFGSFGSNPPYVLLGARSGLLNTDMSVAGSSFIGGDPTHPAVLTFNFVEDSFGAGDFFRFSADTDYLVSDPTPGGAFGKAGVLFSVAFQDGVSASAVFKKFSECHSVATIVAAPHTANAAPVPEPATMLLLGTGLIGLASLRRIRFSLTQQTRQTQ